jgi:serine/threonine protein kinase
MDAPFETNEYLATTRSELEPVDPDALDRLESLFSRLRNPDKEPANLLGILSRNPNFGRFRMIKVLGEGAMGTVFLASDDTLDRQVAIKLPKLDNRDPHRLSRFLREARAAARLRHPNICPIYDVGVFEDHHFLCLAFIDGPTLLDLMSAQKNRQITEPDQSIFTIQKIVQLVRKLAGALAHAHANGIVHRDLKPANILIDKNGEPIITDLGLARFTTPEDHSQLTISGQFIGTPAYMSPEQASGRPDTVAPESDIYSLGVIFYELLTGHLPFEGATGEIIAKKLSGPPKPPSSLNPGVDRKLEAICMQMLARDRKDRYASMDQVDNELSSWPDPSGVVSSSENALAAKLVWDSSEMLHSEIAGITCLETKTSSISTEVPEHASIVPPMWKAILRWVAFAPTAFLVGILAHVVLNFLNSLVMDFNFINPNSLFGVLCSYPVIFGLPGCIIVHVAIYIAPSQEKLVSIIIAGILLFLSGLAAYPAITLNEYLAIFALVCMNCGSIAAAYTISTSQI